MVTVLLRNLLFTIVVPGAGAVLVPWWVLRRFDATAAGAVWPALVVVAAGAALYLWCVWMFAVIGNGTPGPWDAPQHVVATGPYLWVRNPIYLSALLVVVGEAWLFLSLPLLVYAGAMALLFHLFVIGYEEPTLARRFGDAYIDYRRKVPRWRPRIPPRS
jgi:protein-S-isoprenylcysteine O-methyltransferase Ste14